jgi:glycosyltransferase involved in cell wall biosynthesis
MKICYIGGNVPWLMDLMRDMINRGYDVHWIALVEPKRIIPNVRIHKDLLYKHSILNYLFTVLNLKASIRKISPDLIHAFNVRKGGWLAVFSQYQPVIVTPQGGDVMVKERDYSHLPFFRRWLKKSFIDDALRTYTLKNASAVTYGNKTMLAFIRIWAEPKKNIKCFQGINFNTMKSTPNVKNLKRKLGVEDRKIVFSPRMFNSNSNIDIIIQTIPYVIKHNPSVVYIFACHLGLDTYTLKLKQLIEALNVSDYCLFVDEINQSDMPNYYTISDVIISILSSDGMPATVLEAMAMEKPQVLSRIPIYLDVFSRFTTIVKLRDVISTANAIIKTLKKDSEIIQMQKNGYDWVRKNADQKLINDELEKNYLDLINKAAKSYINK